MWCGFGSSVIISNLITCFRWYLSGFPLYGNLPFIIVEGLLGDTLRICRCFKLHINPLILKSINEYIWWLFLLGWTFYWVGQKFGLSRNIMNFVTNLIHWVERNLMKSFPFSPIYLLLIYWLIYLFIWIWMPGNLYCSMISSSLFSLLFWSNSPTFDFIELHHPSPCSLLT